MNKFLSLAAACTLALGFTACEDVPAPYGLPTEKQQQQPASKEVLLEESFASSLGSFKNYTTSGEGAWKIDFKTAKASGYDNAAKKTTAGTYYLVSSEIDLTGVDNAYVALDYIMRYNKGDENQQLLITDAFNAEKPAEGWTVVNQKWTEAADWKNFVNDKVAIPAAFLGKKVHIAFRYNTDDKSGSTWEIKNLTVATGKATQAPAPEPQPEKPVTPENPSQPTTDKALQNGSFETWTDGKPDHWSPTSGSGNATLQQSATAHEGKSSVQVSGDDKANKRLGSNDITLEAGTYTFSVYVRGTVAGSSCRLGFVPVKDGKADSKSYNYEKGYHDNLSTSEWTLVSYTFELKQTTTLSLVVMIPKTKPAFLLDSATLVKK